MRKRRNSTRVLMGVAALTMLFASTAFTASNTVPDSNAGIGTATVSGYTAQSINYNLNATDPSTIDSVDIEITGAVTSGSSAELQLSSAGTWYSCTIGSLEDPDATPDSGDEYTPLACTTTGELVNDATSLSLVIAD